MEDSDTAQVRDFIEKLVENLVEGELDNVNVSCLYTHPGYKPLQDVESPSVIHAQLKQLVKRVVREAMALPTMKQAMENQRTNGQYVPDHIDSQSYEDILATAILNKVIQRYQQDTASPGSSGLAANRNTADDFSVSTTANIRRKYDDEQERNVGDSDVTLPLEEENWSETSHTEPVSFMVEECIEQVTTYNSSEDDHEGAGSTELDFYLSGLNFIQKHRVPFPELGMDIVDGEGSDSDSDADDVPNRTSSHATDLLSPVDSWEENWLFQKRRLKLGSNINQPIPVPMLVPNPSEGFRALIGDQEAEEISDLSECSEEAVEEALSDLDSVQSFTFLGTGLRREEASEGHASKVMDATSLVQVQEKDLRALTPDGGYGGSAEEYTSIQDGGSEMAEATNAQLFKSSSVDCLSEFGQQDSEYTEDYAAATLRQMSSLTLVDLPEPEVKPVPRPRSVCALAQSKPGENSKNSDNEDGRPQVDLVLSTPPRPGTIAEREHKKWESAPPLPNNPYSSENISKRLQKRSLRVSRSSSEASLDFPDASGESRPVVTEPLKVCVGAEPDSNKYGRDYYVNSCEGRAKTERQPKQQAKQVRAVSSNIVDCSSRSASQLSCKETRALQLEQCPNVGREVSRWQKEINQAEKQWLRNVQNGKSESLKRCFSTSVLNTATSTTNATAGSSEKTPPSLPRVADISKLFEPPAKSVANNIPSKNKLDAKCPRMQARKPSNVLVISKNPSSTVSVSDGMQRNDSKKAEVLVRCRPAGKGGEPRVTISCYPKPPCITTEAMVNGNGRPWDTDSVRSEESAVSSIDSEYSPCLPSVKQLAKQFSGSAESDSSASVSNSSHRLSMTDLCSNTKEVVIVRKAAQKEASPQRLSVPSRPLRQVHSLTARSMSREFREGLRRNLPVPLDRNVHSFGGSEWNLTSRRCDEYDTTPGYTSDESGTVSPVPAPGTLRNSISFWESMKQSQ